LSLRARYRPLIIDPSPSTFRVLYTDNPAVLAFARVTPAGGTRIGVAGNTDFHAGVSFRMNLETAKSSVTDLLHGTHLEVQDGALEATLGPGECIVFEY
jgi:hypothetical protein